MEKLYDIRLGVSEIEIRDQKRKIIVLCERLKELNGTYKHSTEKL